MSGAPTAQKLFKKNERGGFHPPGGGGFEVFNSQFTLNYFQQIDVFYMQTTYIFRVGCILCRGKWGKADYLRNSMQFFYFYFIFIFFNAPTFK